MSLIGKWICAFSSKKFTLRDEWTITSKVEWLRWKASELESIECALLPYIFSNNDIVLPTLQHDVCNDKVSMEKFSFFFNFSWKFRVNIFLFTQLEEESYFFLMEELEEERNMMKFELLMKLFFQLFTYTKIVVCLLVEGVEIYDDLLRFWESSYESRLKEKPLNEIFCVFYSLWKTFAATTKTTTCTRDK